MRHYYVLINKFGRISRYSFNRRNGYTVKRFASKQKRSEWLSEHEHNGSNFVAWSVTRSEANYDTFGAINRVERDSSRGYWDCDNELVVY